MTKQEAFLLMGEIDESFVAAAEAKPSSGSSSALIQQT